MSVALVRSLWLVWIAAGVALEFFALGTEVKGDTLTETLVGFARQSWLLKIVLAVFFLWLAVHFWRRFFPSG